jgi:hypothetical protein
MKDFTRFPTPAEIAEEAREAMRRSPESPKEHFDRLVRLGFINTRGEVTKLLGGDAEPETNGSQSPASS